MRSIGTDCPAGLWGVTSGEAGARNTPPRQRPAWGGGRWKWTPVSTFETVIQDQTQSLYLTSPTGEMFTNSLFLLATCFAAKPSPVTPKLPIDGGRSVEVWISPDPARQFASPYSYGSNPVNSVDPDGRLDISEVRTTTVGQSVVSESWDFNVNRWLRAQSESSHDAGASELWGLAADVLYAVDEYAFGGLHEISKTGEPYFSWSPSVSAGQVSGPYWGLEQSYGAGITFGSSGTQSYGLVAGGKIEIGAAGKLGFNTWGNGEKAGLSLSVGESLSPSSH